MTQQIEIFKTHDGMAVVEVRFSDESAWLTLQQIADLFGRDKSVVSRHLKNIFQSKELDESATVAKNATVQKEGGREVNRMIDYYNLDAIISVGYRVNSVKGIQFRIWATQRLKEYLVQGYSRGQKPNNPNPGPLPKGEGGLGSSSILLGWNLKALSLWERVGVRAADQKEVLIRLIMNMLAGE